MGNCCGSSSVDNNDVKTGQSQQYDQFFIDKLNHPNMIARIVKIQAAFRGYMARKYVRNFKQ